MSYNIFRLVRRVKGARRKGFLLPTVMPFTSSPIWTHISMDFVEQLPKSCNLDTILVVVDRFTKYEHFTGLKHPFTASKVAQVFVDIIHQLHGPPKVLASDRDKIFTSLF